jgi:thiol-disulfide isomerase/thioredoxin
MTGRQAPGRRKALLAAGGLTTLLAGAGWGWSEWRQHSRAADVDLSELWARSFPTLDGANLSMNNLRGKPLLLNFWAAWCPPCLEELPLLSSFYAENKANGWQLIGLAVDRGDAVRRFLTRAPVSFPIGMAGVAAGLELMRPLGNEQGGLPFTIVVGVDGQLLHRKIGQVNAGDLAAWRQAAAG